MSFMNPRRLVVPVVAVSVAGAVIGLSLSGPTPDAQLTAVRDLAPVYKACGADTWCHSQIRQTEQRCAKALSHDRQALRRFEGVYRTSGQGTNGNICARVLAI